MEKKKKDLGLIFAAILLMIAGTISIAFAGGDGSGGGAGSEMTVVSVTVTATSGGISTSADLNLITDGNTTTAGIDTNAFLDTNIVVKFNQNVASGNETKAKIHLQKIKNNGSLDPAVLITNSGITISNKNITIDPVNDLTGNTFYLVTVSPGVSAGDGSVSSTATWQAIFKIGTESSSAAPASTTFSAIMTSPASSAYTVTDPVNIGSASFSFTFGETVKNNGLNGAELVTVTKISGGSQSIASDGAIVASAISGGEITFTAMGSGGSTTTTFTVEPAVLEVSAVYQLKLKSTVTSSASKTLGQDLIYSFTTADTGIPVVPFGAISLYPSNGAKDVAVNANLEIGFTQAIMGDNKITNGKAVELLDTVTNTTLPAVFTLSSDATTITVNPNENLAYGRDYQLKILDSKITKADGTSPLSEFIIPFKTTSFRQVAVSIATSGSGLTITAALDNASGSSQNVKIAYVVRRDKGARLEDGGTVVVKGITAQTACAAGQTTILTEDIPDITVDQYGNALTRTVYVDVYVQNNNGGMLEDPIHIRLQ